MQKGHAVTEETFSFLLVGCIQDKERGFLQALQVSPACPWAFQSACPVLALSRFLHCAIPTPHPESMRTWSAHTLPHPSAAFIQPPRLS